MKHFLSLADLSSDYIEHLLNLAIKLKKAYKNGGNEPILRGKSLALLFQKPSLRTRASFELAMVHLGGYAMTLSPSEVRMGERETPADVARVLSGYVDAIMARVFDHSDVVTLAEFASVPVINGLSEFNHPAQALTDLLTMKECKGTLNGLKVVYIGDGNNVARSLLFGAMHVGAHLTLATPPTYSLPEEDYDQADALKSHGASFALEVDPVKAVQDADVIYTDVWVSMGQEEERAARMEAFPPYQVNQALVSQARPDCIVMHCLPAHRGEEITSDVADGPQAVVFQQAENRLHAQKAILADLLTDN